MNLGLTSLLFLWLPFAAATNSSATEEQLANISLFLYKGSVNDYTSVLIGNAVDLLAQINTSKPTVFYLFGWTETPESTSVQTVVGAYLKRGDHNVILVNWEEITGELYPFAAASTGDVGYIVAKALNAMVQAGLNATLLHFVSHSLGSHVAGFVGRHVNFTLPRITGLDPAGPEFYVLIDELTSADAVFVDVIHTDAGNYGTAETDGRVNFYPNGGTRPQPGCGIVTDITFCSHHRSWYYYAESLLNTTAFVGVKCSSNLLFWLGFCTLFNTRVIMGYATPTTATGNYYLRTNGQSPFGRGAAGAN